jgi:hypothetical protein
MLQRTVCNINLPKSRFELNFNSFLTEKRFRPIYKDRTLNAVGDMLPVSRVDHTRYTHSVAKYNRVFLVLGVTVQTVNVCHTAAV